MEDDLNFIKKHKIRVATVDDVRKTNLNDFLRQLPEFDKNPTYISFDVDSMDCDEVSYGTGTPVPTGFYAEEIIRIFDLFLASKKF